MASEENDEAMLFVSGGNRIFKNEHPIQGSDMRLIWARHLMPILPDNVDIDISNESPIKRGYAFLGKFEEEEADVECTIYSHPDDFERNFGAQWQAKYLPQLHKKNRIHNRWCTDPIRASDMRRFLKKGWKKDFLMGLPPGIDGENVWNILK